MEPTNEGGIVQAEPESEQLEGEIGEDEAEAEKEEEVEEADRHQLLLDLNLHLSFYKITKSHSHSIFKKVLKYDNLSGSQEHCSFSGRTHTV